MKRILFALGLVMSMVTCGWAASSYDPTFIPTPAVDLADPAVYSGTIGGVTFAYHQDQPTGTGVFNPFLTVQNSPNEQGYNSDTQNFDTKRMGNPASNDGWTRSVQLGELVPVDGFYIFSLDLGEGGGPNSLISLDGLKIFVSSDGNQGSESIDGAGNANGIVGNLLYNMDAAGDVFVLLDDVRRDAYEKSHPGQGTSDMLMYVPVSLFSGSDPNDYLILWSRFGLQYGAEAYEGIDATSESTFEEWSALLGSAPVPEPGTMLLLGTGLFGLAVFGKRRMNRES